MIHFRAKKRLLAAMSVLLVVTCTSVLPAQGVIPRILNGEPTEDFPSVGTVGSLDFGDFCSGTLITPRHVLTAAHCADEIALDDSATFTVNGQIYLAEEIVIHEDYNPFRLTNDIAILVLSEEVGGVEPLPLLRVPPMVGETLIIVGFGQGGTGDGATNDFGTKRVGMTTIEEVTSNQILWTFDDNTESNTSSGDSGGPGLIEIDGVYYIAGVTSGGTVEDGLLGDEAFDTRVDVFADWIDDVVDSFNQEPPTGDDEEQEEPPVEEDPEEEPGDDNEEDPPVQDDEPEEGDTGWTCPSFGFGWWLRPLWNLLAQIWRLLNQEDDERGNRGQGVGQGPQRGNQKQAVSQGRGNQKASRGGGRRGRR